MFKVEQPATTFPGAAFSAARAELWLARPGLASCVRAVMSRDTRGTDLRAEQRYNHVPATPVCSIAWYFSGHGELLEPGCPAQADSPRTRYGSMVFCGPFTRPTISWNPGPVHVMFLLLLPDALAALTGIDPGAYLDRVVPVEEVFDGAWLDLCQRVMAVADEERAVELIEAFLHPLWQQARPDQTLADRIYADWSSSLALRAATSGWGRSLRQVERRIKQWTGQPLRELRGFSRSEQAFFDAVLASRAGAVNWSEVAGNNGYADQSHFCRQARRITGFAPEELRRRIYTEESFWSYRLWGFSAGL